MTTLLIAEHDNAHLKDATHKALSAATALGGPVHVLVAGTNAKAAADAAAKLDGVEKVLLADARALRAPARGARRCADRVAGRPPTMRSWPPPPPRARTCMPRVAALLDVMQVSDITKVVSPDTFERPIYAGNAIQTVQATDAKKVITVRIRPSRRPPRVVRLPSRTSRRRRIRGFRHSRARRLRRPTGPS